MRGTKTAAHKCTYWAGIDGEKFNNTRHCFGRRGGMVEEIPNDDFNAMYISGIKKDGLRADAN